MAVEVLQEYASSHGLKPVVDRAAGVIKGVKILGLQSRNGRSYLPSALAQGARLYEGAKVNVNHAAQGAARSYQDRIGLLRGIVARDDGLFADFYFNPKHPVAEQLQWDAENAPENVGFSHVVEAKTRRERGVVVVEEIQKVESVDLVANPATTSGLFETTIKPERKTAVEWQELTVESIKEYRADLAEVLSGTDTVSKLTAEVKTLKETLAIATNERDAMKAAAAEANKAAAIQEELKDAKLDANDKKVVSEAFLAQLKAAPDTAGRKVLIEDRKALLPTRQQQISGGAPPMAALSEGRDQSTRLGTTVQETLSRL
jgi:hypothetical protein